MAFLVFLERGRLGASVDSAKVDLFFLLECAKYRKRLKFRRWTTSMLVQPGMSPSQSKSQRTLGRVWDSQAVITMEDWLTGSTGARSNLDGHDTCFVVFSRHN